MSYHTQYSQLLLQDYGYLGNFFGITTTFRVAIALYCADIPVKLHCEDIEDIK